MKELVAKWRELAKELTTKADSESDVGIIVFNYGMARKADECADELEAALPDGKDGESRRKMDELKAEIFDRLSRLERQSDNGAHMNIPANISSGLLWETCQDIRLFWKYHDEVEDAAIAKEA